MILTGIHVKFPRPGDFYSPDGEEWFKALRVDGDHILGTRLRWWHFLNPAAWVLIPQFLRRMG